MCEVVLSVSRFTWFGCEGSTLNLVFKVKIKPRGNSVFLGKPTSCPEHFGLNMALAGGDNFDDEIRSPEIVKRSVLVSPDSNLDRCASYMVFIDFDSGASLA